MTKRTRRNHSGSFKAKVAALHGNKTLTEIAQHYAVHPNQVTEWKRQLPERASEVFDGGTSTVKTDNEPDIKTLHAKIGQLALENGFLSGELTKAGLLSAKK